jgi:PAS domain S-box-containing protein
MSMPTSDFPAVKRLSARWIPAVVLVVGCGLTFAAWTMVSRELNAAAAARFDRMRERAATLMREEFRTLEQALYAGQALARRPGPIPQAEWRDFAGDMQRFLDRQVVGIGYVERVDRTALAAVEARIRADGLPGFTIERDGTAAQAYVVTHLEPREANAAALGLDISAGTTRRAAAEEAMRTARPVLSRRIQIVEGTNRVPGCLLLLPVYAGTDDPGTPDARSAALRGWVYVSIRIDRLVASAMTTLADLMEFEVYEGAAATPEALLYDSDGTLGMTDATWPGRQSGVFAASDRLELHGQVWNFRLRSRPGFDRLASSELPSVILFGGLFATLLGTGLTWTLVNSRARGLALAERMTTDLRQAEAQAARLAVVARHAGTNVVLMDADWRIEWVNESFTRCLGYTWEEVLGRRPSEVLHGAETSAQTLAELNRELEAGRSFRGEILNYAKDGSPRWLELDVQPLRGPDGRVTGYMGLQVDITERRRQSDELRQAMDDARRADQAKSQFLAMMSHEIRTPMNGVIGMTSLLLDSPLSREQRDYVETIRQSGDALLGIINEILDFSKIESGRLELEEEPCCLRDCLESALDLLAPKAAEKQLDLLYEIDERVPYTVRTDQTRLRQILVNLLGNAIKFTLRGEVLLTVRAAERPDGRVELRFAVRDTGIGIAPEALPRLFQPFSQIDASTARRFGGTGLGLAISQRLAGLLGGTMWVESVLGQGSTFHFTILTQEVAGRPTAGESRGVLGGLRVLLVDDNATSRRILGGLFTRWGLAPVGVESGSEALRQLEGDQPFDVAIIDLHMPVMDGAALARAIRARRLPAPLPLILLCHAGQREQLAEPEMFAACVTKPVKPSPLLDALSGIFRDRSVASARSAAPFVPRPAPAARPTERVLVAEDNKVNLKVALLMLQKLGYEADVAGDGIAVIEAVRRQHYDVILMDVQMPGLDGLEVTRRIRAGAAGRPDKVWIIAVTANAMEGDRQSCLAAGMDDYVTKPIDILELEWALVRAHHALTTR